MIPVIPLDFLRAVPAHAVAEALRGFDTRDVAVILAVAPPAVGAELLAALPDAVAGALAEIEQPADDTVRLIEHRLELALRPQI